MSLRQNSTWACGSATARTWRKRTQDKMARERQEALERFRGTGTWWPKGCLEAGFLGCAGHSSVEEHFLSRQETLERRGELGRGEEGRGGEKRGQERRGQDFCLGPLPQQRQARAGTCALYGSSLLFPDWGKWGKGLSCIMGQQNLVTCHSS